MKNRLLLAALPAAFLGLGACSTYDGYWHDDGYGYSDYGYSDYGYGTSYGQNSGYGASYNGGLVWHDGYYDNFYGPVFGGYWDPYGYFWYQSRYDAPYVRDHARHFRRDHFNGGNQFRYQDRRGGGRDGGWDRDRNDRNTYPPLFSGQQDNRGRDDRNNNGRDNRRRGGDDDRGRDNNDRNRDGGWNNTDRARVNPAPPPQQQPRRDDNDRARNGNRGNDNRDGRNRDDANRNDNNRGGDTPPPLFSGQQPPRAAPPPPPPQARSEPELDGAPRSGNRNDDGQRGNRQRGDRQRDRDGDRDRDSNGRGRRGDPN